MGTWGHKETRVSLLNLVFIAPRYPRLQVHLIYDCKATFLTKQLSELYFPAKTVHNVPIFNCHLQMYLRIGDILQM